LDTIFSGGPKTAPVTGARQQAESDSGPPVQRRRPISTPYEFAKSIGTIGKEEQALYDFVCQFEPAPTVMANAVTGVINIDATFAGFKKSPYDAGLQKIIDEYEAGL
jgi:hypothetical protein